MKRVKGEPEMSERLTATEFEWAYMRGATIDGVKFDEYDVVVRSKAYIEGKPFPNVEKTFAKLKSRPEYR